MVRKPQPKFGYSPETNTSNTLKTLKVGDKVRHLVLPYDNGEVLRILTRYKGNKLLDETAEVRWTDPWTGDPMVKRHILALLVKV